MSFSSSNSSSSKNGDNIPKEIRRGLKVSDLAYNKAYQRSVFVYKAPPPTASSSDKVGQHDDDVVVVVTNDNDDGKIIANDPINTVEVTETVDGDVYYKEPLCTSPTNTFTSRVNLHGGELGKKRKETKQTL